MQTEDVVLLESQLVFYALCGNLFTIKSNTWCCYTEEFPLVTYKSLEEFLTSLDHHKQYIYILTDAEYALGNAYL